MRHLIGWRARTGIERDPLGALATDIFVVRFAHVALGKASERWRDAIGDPMIDASTAAAFRVDHQKNETLGTVRHIAPGELGRDVIANAIRIVVAVCFCIRNLLRHQLAVCESGRFQRENVRSFGGDGSEAAVATAKMDFLIMFIPLMFFAAANGRDAHANPVARGKFLREHEVPWEPGNRAFCSSDC
jgi:hypothetical protein